MSNNKSVKVLFPVLGIVFGAGVGILVSMLSSLHIAAGIIGGAAAGLLLSLIVSILKGNGAKDRV